MGKLLLSVVNDLRRISFYFSILIAFVTLISFQNCGKVKFTVPEKIQAIVPQSCGTISMTPSSGIYPPTSISFQVTPPNGITISNLNWVFTKGNTQVHSSNQNPASYTFNTPSTGAGNYVATATFTKNDGNSCELEQSFQVLVGDICASPAGISGPSIGFVGEETSPFSVSIEPCYQGTAAWDMNGDGVPEYTNIPAGEQITHIYTMPGIYTVAALLLSNEGAETTLIHTIDIRYQSCVNPLDTTQTISHGQSITAYEGSSVAYGQSCNSEQRTCNNGALSGSFTNATCSVGQPGSCTFNGQTVAHNSSVTAYHSSSVSYGSTCTSESRTCTNGVLSGTYTHPSCSVGQPGSCTFNGQTVAHGSSVTAYQSSSVSYGSTCTSESRTCTNGVLSGTYTHPSCSVGSAASCTFNGQTVANGSSVTAYQSSSVAYGSTCTSQARTCTNGVLSGTYTHPSCSVGSAASCTLDGVTVAHGASRTFYTNAGEGCGGSCSSQSRTCTNGTLSGSSSYNRASCNATPCNSCTFNGQSVANGSSVTAYQSSSVAYGSTCTSQSRTCTNGVLSGSYTHASCSVGQPASCTFNGQTVAHGSSVTAYQSSSVAYGQACASEARTCNNGSLSGSYSSPSCLVGAPSACSLPWGGSIAHGASVTAYSANQVACGQACASQTRSCNNGSLSGSYTSQSCSVAACPVNGACGSANGSTVTSAPTSNLCSSGSASSLSGSGPWSWTCSGSNGGSTSSCSANAAPVVENSTYYFTCAWGMGNFEAANFRVYRTQTNGTWGPWRWGEQLDGGGDLYDRCENPAGPAQGTCVQYMNTIAVLNSAACK